MKNQEKKTTKWDDFSEMASTAAPALSSPSPFHLRSQKIEHGEERVAR